MLLSIQEKIKEIVTSFNQLPYLFVGTGLSMRYANAFSWGDLLYQIWCVIYGEDRFKFDKALQRIEYELNSTLINKTDEQKKYYVFPQLASELQYRFNTLYYTDEAFESRVFTKEESKDIIQNKYDPFKFYVTKCTLQIYIDVTKPEYAELDTLVQYQNKIAGIITTNYDTCLENLFKDFEVMIGQEKILLSNVNSIFEIYKIHGCVSDPNSIVFTSNDYQYFDDKLKYLSSKLLTIFVEHPVIFIGYGMGDPNIQELFSAISECLSPDALQKAKDNFIFITPAFGTNEELRTREFNYGTNKILMTELVLNDYSIFYKELGTIVSSMPVKLMRKMQDMVTRYVYSTTATNNIIFGSINSPDIDDGKAAIYVGSIDTISQIGFDSFDIMDILEDVLFNNKPFLMNQKLITNTFKNIRSISGSTYLPVYKYIKSLNMSIDDIPGNYLVIKSCADIKPNSTEKKYVDTQIKDDFIQNIVNAYPNHLPKQFANIKYYACYINADELGDYLRSHYKNGTYFERTRVSAFKKLTALYDYLKYNN
ncbi:SIR2 family protein [Cellulosilyticum sp. WCF-2]|uniref:SIR2 family protein n=1 Tax=Cellulosilyticum sp. WCF-2 TaxID=2497860 RepID=UPI000F8E0B6A|nr:SIR2 family protein [Cellulosilyticum sp. WCF-2]QEH69902.1 SIR2 family protein [Cellulosilyticum sp. WCF-2]